MKVYQNTNNKSKNTIKPHPKISNDVTVTALSD